MSNEFGLVIERRVDKPSPELAGYLMAYEGVDGDAGWWVTADRPRDFVWTDEIVKKTSEYRLVSFSGKVLATFESLEEAEEAEATAEVDFTTKFKVGSKTVPVETINSKE